MYLRRRHRIKNGKRHAYWALVESYRTARGPRQRVVAWLGELDLQGRLAIRQQEAEGNAGYQRGLFEDQEPEWIEVDLKRIAVERTCKFGGPWLGLELLRRLGLDKFVAGVLPAGREEVPWAVMGTSERRVLHVAKQRNRLDARRVMADVYPVDGSGGSVPNPEIGFADPTGLASTCRWRVGPLPGLLSRLRFVEDSGADVLHGWLGK